MCTLVHKGRRKQSVIVSPPEKLKTAGLRGSGNGRLWSKSNLPSHLRPTIHSRSDKESSPFTGWGSRAGLLRCHLCWNKGQAHRRKRLQPGKPLTPTPRWNEFQAGRGIRVLTPVPHPGGFASASLSRPAWHLMGAALSLLQFILWS